MARKDAHGGKASKKSVGREKRERNGVYSQKAIRIREAILESRIEKRREQQRDAS